MWGGEREGSWPSWKVGVYSNKGEMKGEEGLGGEWEKKDMKKREGRWVGGGALSSTSCHKTHSCMHEGVTALAVSVHVALYIQLYWWC